MHLDIQRCHQKYGDLICYAPNQLLSLDPRDLTTIYGHGNAFRKSKGYETMIPIDDGWSAMTSIDKSLHRNLRKVFRAGVTTEYLSRFEPAILRHLEVYFSQLMKVVDKEGWCAAGDMRRWNLCLGFDTMADFGLGLKTDLLCSHDRQFVLPALHLHEKKMGLWEQLPFLSQMGIGNLVAAVIPLVSGKANEFARWYQDFLSQAISKNELKSSGIFGPVIQSGMGKWGQPGHNYAQMIGEGSFSTFSSADAYGILLSGFLHYLAHHPRVYHKLAGELRARYKPGQKITWGPELESIVYLRAVIDEVMRLLPPACGVHWRECEKKGVSVGGKSLDLPVGSDVGMSIFSLFRDGRLFRNPVEFWPERWIPGTLPADEYAACRKMFVPFLIGPRNCAGSHVAIMMASIAYTHVLVNYDFRRDGQQPHKVPSSLWSNTEGVPGSEVELQFESHYSIAGWEKGPFIQFRARIAE